MNYPAIIVAAIAAYAAYAVWCLFLFSKPYVAALGKTRAQMDAGPSALAASIMQVIGLAVTFAVLSWLMKRTGMTGVVQGLTLAVLLWIGFVVAVLAPMYAFEANNNVHLAINCGGVLISLLIGAAILGAWKK